MENFPALLITGPRQSGKSTFLLHALKDSAEYVTFDDPLERQFADSDPKGFLRRFSGPVILDEIQYVPGLFPYLKIEIDSNRNDYGRWILTGSHQFHLMKSVKYLRTCRPLCWREKMNWTYRMLRSGTVSVKAVQCTGGTMQYMYT